MEIAIYTSVERVWELQTLAHGEAVPYTYKEQPHLLTD